MCVSLACVSLLLMAPAAGATSLDAAIASDAAVRPPLATLAAELERLRWSSAKTTAKVKRSLEAQARFVEQAPSEICADARAIASTNAQQTPVATLQFIANLTALEKESGLRGVQDVLVAFATKNDRHEYTSARRRLERSAAAETTLLESVLSKIVAGLGLTP
jgi:hypothetical protein